jgi:putative phosphonate metabolism protein
MSGAASPAHRAAPRCPAGSRVALYYVPARDSAWWAAGCEWLGRDPESGAALMPPLVPALDARGLDVAQLTRAPRRYGWHGTLLAPAHLPEDLAFDALLAHARDWARRQTPFDLPVTVDALGRFVALRPATDAAAHAMRALAADALHAFAPWRAMPSAAERARRLDAGLSERQQALLERWGYPYVLDEFRFHMTLSDSIDTPEREILIDWWRSREAALGALRIAQVGLFVEPQRDASFTLVARLPLGNPQARGA